MTGQGKDGGRSRTTPADIQAELHRLHESQMRLVLLAEEVGLAVPRSCCPHAGEAACPPCAAEWLAANVRRMARSAEAV